MKKIISLVLALALPLGLAACGTTSVPVAGTEASAVESTESTGTEKAEEVKEAADTEKAEEELYKAQRIINYLDASLDRRIDISSNLDALYDYFVRSQYILNILLLYTIKIINF